MLILVINMKLTELKPQEKAVISRLDLSEEYQRRLLHLGVYKGAVIRMERLAPLGDPLEYFVCGNLLILRRGDAQKIEITREGKV